MKKRVYSDLAIMGSGLAGLGAAYMAAKEHNMKVAVFEKRPFQGGSVSNCPIQMMSVPDDRKCLLKALDVVGEFTNYACDLGLVRTWFTYSSRLPKLVFEDLGIKYDSAVYVDPDTYGTERAFGGVGFPKGMDVGDYYFMRGRGLSHAAPLICLRLRREIEKMGGEFYFSTPITEITREENGKVTGAKARSVDGKDEYEIVCKAVCVASGGFSNDKKMLKEELGLTLENDIYPSFDTGKGNVMFIHFPNGKYTGDGQKAVWKIGGYKGGMAVTGPVNVPNPGVYGNVPFMAVNQTRIMQEQPYLWVNRLGERFMNEEMSAQHMASAVHVLNQPGNYAWMIFDEDTAVRWSKRGCEDGFVYFVFQGVQITHIREQLDKMIEAGSVHVAHADTISELCEKTGICEKGLRKTLERYNSYCDIGMDEEFGKASRYLYPVREESGHLYALRVLFGGYMTLGGIKVNRYCQVLDVDKNVIPGLYSAGDMISGSIFGDPPTCGTGTLSQALSTGLAAGDYASQFIREEGK